MRRRSQATTVPDSEDDAPFSETSLKDSSPSYRSGPRRKSGLSHTNSRTHRVIPDSEEDEDPIDLISPRVTRQRSAAKIQVVVPGKKDESSSDSTRSSLGLRSADEAPSVNTPTTSVDTGAESDIKMPRARVNASDRAQQIRSSGRPLKTLQRGTMSGVDETNDDAALAEALQTEEYMMEYPKKRKASTQGGRSSMKRRLQDEDEMVDDLLSISDEASLPPSLVTDDGYDVDLDSEAEEEYLEGIQAGLAQGAANAQVPSHLNPWTDDAYDSHDEPTDDGFDDEDRPPSWDEMRKAQRMEKERKKLVQNHPVVGKMWDDLKAQPVLSPPPAGQPTSITRKLKPFQLEGLSWMIEQEKSSYRGGLLGDEMGMGKTIQAVSLIMSDFPQPNPTLVIVPPVALMQWQKEIKVLCHFLGMDMVGN